MTITQTVDIPADRRIMLEVPREVPPGRTILAFTPVSERQGKPVLETGKGSATPLTDSLSGILSSLGDISLEEIREERLAKYLK
jgi:tRNA A58 N-methylase Trm61